MEIRHLRDVGGTRRERHFNGRRAKQVGQDIVEHDLSVRTLAVALDDVVVERHGVCSAR